MTDIETLRWTAQEILPLKQRDWLDRALEMLRVNFYQIGVDLPKDIDIVVDYPDSALPYPWLGTYQRCWIKRGPIISHKIFINPSVDGLLALDILAHELVHSVTLDGDHGDEFMEIASAIGLDDTGPTAGAEEVLLKRLKDIQETLGSYPLVFDCLETA
jgi:hypothetical protein